MANSHFYNPYHDGGLGSSAASGQLELPTIENILKDNYESLISARNTMNADYSNLVNSFNELTENELVMLNEAGISVKNLKNLTNKYEELYSNMENKAKLKDLFDSQKQDSSKLYNKSEYTMALTGIASIASLMYVFNYMKK
jgi:phosphoenolpyruvate carboxylase